MFFPESELPAGGSHGGRGAQWIKTRWPPTGGWRWSNAELPGSDGWLEGFEELHNKRALEALDDGLLNGERANCWLTSLWRGFVERDGQELRPDGGSYVVEDTVGPHLTPLGERVRSVASWGRLVGVLRQALGRGSAPALVTATSVLTVRLRMLWLLCPSWRKEVSHALDPGPKILDFLDGVGRWNVRRHPLFASLSAAAIRAGVVPCPCCWRRTKGKGDHLDPSF